MAIYTDRAHWAVHTPTSGSAPDRRRPTQVGRAPARLGIEHILGYSPQARGRSERVNRTLQDRLVNVLRVAGVTAAANRYLRTHFLAAFDAEFARPPADPRSAFVPWGASISSRSCASSTSAWSPAITSSPPVSSRSCAGLRVLVRRHLNGHHSVWYGSRCLGRFDSHGHPVLAA